MGVSWPIWPDTPHLMTASLGVGDNYLLPTALEEGETVSTTMMRDWRTDDMRDGVDIVSYINAGDKFWSR